MSSPTSREAGRRGVLVFLGVLLVILLVVDLVRRDSFLRSLVPGGDSQTPAERVIDDFRGGPVRSVR